MRAIGVTVRHAARSADPADEFERDQLMSAYSATRHLSAELATYAPELGRFTAATARRLRDAGLDDDAARIDGETDVAEVGDALAGVLDRLRDDNAPDAAALRTELHRLLRELADTEVNLLADGLA